MKKTAGSTGVSPASKEDPNPGTRNLELETRSCWTKPRLLATAYWRLLTLAIFAFCFAACSPTYVLRAGYEEAKILWNRRPITEVLARTDIDPTTREKLELVLRVRRFVEQELAFNVGGSYSTITELNKPPIVYVVTAAPRTKLEPYTWWFPIIGQVAYKGYFEQAEAQQEAQRLEAQGYDTYVRAAMAFSTLGWFADPLLPHLLRYGHETLANIIVHELFHSTFYLKGQSAFNESLANFAGHRGAVAFFTKEFGQEAAVTRQAQTTWDNEQAVSAFLATGVERLNALYLSSASEEEKRQQRETLFAQLQQEFRSLPGPIRQNTDFATVRLNNAVVLQYLMYLRDLPLFERIYQQQGENLRTTLERIIEAAKAKDDPFAAVHNLVGGAQHVAFFPPISLPSSAIFSPTVWVVPEEDFPPIVFDRLNNYRRSS